jgi:hypothetical protein
MTPRACLLLCLLGCASSEVKGGYPPLTQGCKLASDCGGPYQCLDGGCEILACERDADCPQGLGCSHIVGDSQGQCLLCGVASCDGGVTDGGLGDGGADAG